MDLFGHANVPSPLELQGDSGLEKEPFSSLGPGVDKAALSLFRGEFEDARRASNRAKEAIDYVEWKEIKIKFFTKAVKSKGEAIAFRNREGEGISIPIKRREYLDNPINGLQPSARPPGRIIGGRAKEPVPKRENLPEKNGRLPMGSRNTGVQGPIGGKVLPGMKGEIRGDRGKGAVDLKPILAGRDLKEGRRPLVLKPIRNDDKVIQKDNKIQSPLKNDKDTGVPAETKVELKNSVRIETNKVPRIEPKIEVDLEPEVQSEIESKVEPKVEAKVEPENVLQVEPKTEITIKPVVEPEVEPENVIQVEPKTEITIEPKVEPEIEPKDVIQVEPKDVIQVEPKTKVTIEPEVEPNDMIQVEPKTEITIEPKVEPKDVIQVEPKTKVTIEPEVEPKAESKTVLQVEPKIVIQVEPKTALLDEPKNVPQLESKIEVKNAAQVEQKVEVKKVPEVEPKTVPKPIVQPEPKIEPKPDAQKKAETKPSAEGGDGDFKAFLRRALHERRGYLAQKALMQSVEFGGEEADSEPYRIAWDLFHVKMKLASEGANRLLEPLKDLIDKADDMLRKSIRIRSKNRPDLQRIFKKKEELFCGTYFRQDTTIDAHLFIFISAVFEKESARLASAGSCTEDLSIATDRSKAMRFGQLIINFEALEKSLATDLGRDLFVKVLVHEVLHILAFSKAHYLEIFSPSERQPHLQMIRSSPVNDWIANDGEYHVSQGFTPNDLMVPLAGPEQQLTIYDLEYLENRSDLFLGNRRNLPHDARLGSLDNEEDFWNYRCPDAGIAKYFEFCTPAETKAKAQECSLDFTQKTLCVEQPLSNNCRLRYHSPKGFCLDPTQPKKHNFEEFSEKSRCFMTVSKVPLCLAFSLAPDGVELIIENQKFACKKGQDKVRVKFHKPDGSLAAMEINCPDYDSFIFFHRQTSCPGLCHGNGRCDNGKCVCYEGYDSSSHCKGKSPSHSALATFTEVPMHPLTLQ